MNPGSKIHPPALAVGGRGEGPPNTHILEATVEGLQLLLGELGLRQQLLQPLGLVPYGRKLQLGVTAVCWEMPAKTPVGVQQPLRIIPHLIPGCFLPGSDPA